MEAQHIPPESLVEEIAHLRHCLRSLVALSTLPAIWTGRAPGEIAHSLADALFSMLRPEIAYVRFNGLPSGEVIQAIRVDRDPQTAAEPDQIGLALTPWVELSTSSSTRSIPHPAGSGELVLTTAPIGHAGEYGMVAACSRRADFPTEIDRLVLSLGANQVTTALQGMHMVAALRESEALFRGTFDNAAVGMAHVALDGRWLRVNDRLCAITGYAREELLARRSREITHPEDVATDEALARRIVAGELPTSIWEKRYIRKDGSTAFVNLTASALRDQAGQPRHLITIVEDITARKRAETLLRQAHDEMEAQVRARTADLQQTNAQLQAESAERRRMAETLRERANLLDLTHDTVFVRDLRDVITYWNRGAEALYGWTREEAVGTVSHQLMQTIFPAPLGEINEALLNTGRWEGELVHAKRDGTQVVVASRWSLQRDGKGNPLAILETNNDITERKRAEAALRESEEQWKAVFEHNPTMYFMVDAAGTILSVNPFGAEQLGYTVDELAGSPVLNVFYAADREAVQRNVSVCLEHLGRARSWEFRKVRKDGTMLWVRETAKAVLLKNHPVVLVVCEDITERRRAEEALQKAQTELAHVTRVTTLGELATSIAHEINQPLAAIVTNGSAGLRWLAGAPPHLDDAREALQCIIDDGQRASAIITRIRALLRKTALERTWLDLPPLVHEVVRLAQPERVRQGVTLLVDLAADLLPVWGDRVQLQQVLLNLVTNALEAMAGVAQGPRELVIRVRPEAADTVLVAVEDTGVGIDRQQREAIFTAFYTTKAQGLGMGLAISRSIVEQHGGRLWAVPHDGPGATVQFTLRTAPAAG